jgi:hypothetical protein
VKACSKLVDAVALGGLAGVATFVLLVAVAEKLN